MRRTALVGGGAAGIGRAVAEDLARAGHRVVVTGRRPAVLEQAARELSAETGSPVHPLVGDMADTGAAAGLLARIGEEHGPPDVLVLNAGGPPPGSVFDLGDDQWRSAFELLVLGPLRLARLALPAMAQRGFGRVVVVTSTAVRQPQPDLAASVVLRSAVTAAAKLLSREYAADGVTVNCVAPGATATERRTQVLTSRALAAGRPYEDLVAEDTAAVPAARPARPAEIAAAVTFLASPAASYINGTVLTVDGGRTETI
ncbi:MULTISPECIES: SDR family oxidoreductase [unclassified Streptomyces]|uniref:SDR family oxidoreductase n=1 Tax=unclassified Streptomyces TaxID=2593676 RepID=UPI003815E84E